MPENINTTPLGDIDSELAAAADDRPVMVDVDRVSMVFNMASQQLNSLKEYAIALAKRELMFKEFRALDGVSFTVRKGDVFGILGTNGSGKSTMLKIIAGVLEPTEGPCTINGSIAPLIELGAGFDMELTARENIFLNGALLGYSKKFIQQHFDEIVDFAEVEKFLDMPMKNYSSGMVARIAFAIATVIVPEILIVDEVLSVGDFMFQQKCERRITQLIKEHDVTVLIVSHNNDQIERLCNKAIWIEKGHTRMMGSAADVCRTYRVLGGHVGSPESEAAVFDMLNSPTRVPEGLVSSVAGYGTAVKIAEKCRFAPGGSVILASGDFSLPCMSAQGLSGMLDAPVLLSKHESLPDVVAQEIASLAPRRIVVLGGEDVLSSEVVEQAKDAASDGCAICRIDCNESVELARLIFDFGKRAAEEDGVPGWSKLAIIAHHDCLGDLITLSPLLFNQHIPVFYIRELGVIDEATTASIQGGDFTDLLVLGVDKHIPDTFLAACATRGVKSERLIGKNPYDANEKINDLITSGQVEGARLTIDNLIVSSVWNPADAFAAGAWAAKTDSAFLLEDPQNLDSVAHAISYIKKKGGSVKHLTFLGDSSQFGRLDKEMLGKAVQEALVDAGLADGAPVGPDAGTDAGAADHDAEGADQQTADAASADTQENE